MPTMPTDQVMTAEKYLKAIRPKEAFQSNHKVRFETAPPGDITSKVIEDTIFELGKKGPEV